MGEGEGFGFLGWGWWGVRVGLGLGCLRNDGVGLGWRVGFWWLSKLSFLGLMGLVVEGLVGIGLVEVFFVLEGVLKPLEVCKVEVSGLVVFGFIGLFEPFWGWGLLLGDFVGKGSETLLLFTEIDPGVSSSFCLWRSSCLMLILPDFSTRTFFAGF